MTNSHGAAVPEGLEARLATLVRAGDADGIALLYAPDAVVSLPGGREAAGRAAIRQAYAAALAAGALRAAPAAGEVTARAVVSGNLAMTTSTCADGTVRTQVARREPDGDWVWVRDGSRLRDVEACRPVACAADAVA